MSPLNKQLTKTKIYTKDPRHLSRVFVSLKFFEEALQPVNKGTLLEIVRQDLVHNRHMLFKRAVHDFLDFSQAHIAPLLFCRRNLLENLDITVGQTQGQT